jgi:hypothetical protein
MYLKKNIFLLFGAIIIFGIGFIFGMEYKAIQVRSALNAVSKNEDLIQTPTKHPFDEIDIADEDSKLIVKNVGEEVVLATGNITINGSEETQTLTSKYSSPKIAKEGAKFIIINLDIINTTKSEFSFYPDNVFILRDSKGREFRTYSDSIGALDNYIDYRTLSPSIKESGFLTYEVPNDSIEYSLIVSKAGTNEIYSLEVK